MISDILAFLAALVRLLQRPNPSISNEVAEVPELILVTLDVELIKKSASIWLDLFCVPHVR